MRPDQSERSRVNRLAFSGAPSTWGRPRRPRDAQHARAGWGSAGGVRDRAGRTDDYPFGMPMGSDVPSSWLFTGHEKDGATGLDYMLARLHSASVGSFVSVDPAQGSSSMLDPQAWNRFAYVGNNPLAYRDPDGEWRRSVTVAPGTTSSRERNRVLVRAGLRADQAIARNPGEHLERAHEMQKSEGIAYDVVLDDSRSAEEGATSRFTQEGGLHFGENAFNAHDVGIGGQQSVEVTIPTGGMDGDSLETVIEDALVHELTEVQVKLEREEPPFGNLAAHEVATKVTNIHRAQRVHEKMKILSDVRDIKQNEANDTKHVLGNQDDDDGD